MKRMLHQSIPAVLAAATAAAVALSPPAAHAQFNLVNGSNNGILELASYNTAAGGALPIFAGDGQMIQAGGGFPALTGVNTPVNNTGLVPLPAAINSAAVGNYGGGAASLFSVSGNRAGIFTTNFGVSDANNLNGIASESAMYGQGSWTYNGPAGVFIGGAFLSMTATVNAAVFGSYVEAGVDAQFLVNGNAVGQSFISVGFDGVPLGAYPGGPAASFINAGSYSYVTNGPSLTFSAASLVAFNLNPGDTLSIQGTLTAFGDPASIDYLPLPSLDGGNDDTGVGIAPEPGSFALLLPLAAPAMGLVLHRRRRGIV